MTMTSIPDREPAAPPWRDTTLSVADRVEDLLERDDSRGEGRPARQPLAGQRHAGRGPPASLAADPDTTFNVAPLQDVFAASGTISLEDASRHGLGHLTRVFGSHPVTVAEGAAELVRQQRVVLDGSRLRHPGARPRGVPHRVHDLRGNRLPRGDRVGCDVRPRPRRADGGRDRPRHGRRRRAPGAFARARRRTGLPLGPGRGDHRRGPLPRRDARRRLRPRPAERRRHRHAEALRRLLGLAGGTQPRPGADGPARAGGRHPADVRDRGRRWAGPAR